MLRHETFLSLVVWLSVAPCAPGLPRGGPEPPAPATPSPARVYTNEDLERVRPFRHELGAQSTPAVGSGTREPPFGSARRGRDRSRKPAELGEAYWRREATKLRERLRRLADRREELRIRLAERRDAERRALRPARGARAAGTASQRTTEAQLAAIERRMRELEADLMDRARRAGALPGWLR